MLSLHTFVYAEILLGPSRDSQPTTLKQRNHRKNVEDVYAFGFRNLKIRCNAATCIHSIEDEDIFNAFLDAFEMVVDDCLSDGVWPIISWIHEDAEIHPNEQYRQQ